MKKWQMFFNGLNIGMLSMFLIHYAHNHPDYEYFIFPIFLVIVQVLATIATIKDTSKNE